MCDSSENLVAWMDGELAENDAAVIEAHVGACAECRAQLSAYEEASCGFAAYYAATTDASVATNPPRHVSRWVPVLVAAAAVVVFGLILLPRPQKQVPVIRQASVAPVTIAQPDVAAPIESKPVQRRHVTAHKKVAATNWAMAEPAIQIAIPADEIFPPGAVPEGVTFVANLSADGSVRGLRLRP